MLTQGHDRDTIAAAVGVTPGQVSAISAHVGMGTYCVARSRGTAGAGGLRGDRKDEQLAAHAAEP